MDVMHLASITLEEYYKVPHAQIKPTSAITYATRKLSLQQLDPERHVHDSSLDMRSSQYCSLASTRDQGNSNSARVAVM